MFCPIFVTLAAQHVFHAAFAHHGAHVDVNHGESSENDGAANVDDESQECAVLRERSEDSGEQKEQTCCHQRKTENCESPEESFLTGVSKPCIRMLGFAA